MVPSFSYLRISLSFILGCSVTRQLCKKIYSALDSSDLPPKLSSALPGPQTRKSKELIYPDARGILDTQSSLIR